MAPFLLIRISKLLLAVLLAFAIFCTKKPATILPEKYTYESKPLYQVAASFNKPDPSQTQLIKIEMKDSAFICWAPPLDHPDSVDHYELFYRTQRDLGWTPLNSSIPVAKTQYTIYRKDFNNLDTFYFGIRSVLKSRLKSDFLFSTDSTGGAPSGWAIIWR